MIREKFVGIRPAPGYPASPDHSLKALLFDMLGGAPGEVRLTQYFGVAKIGRDQAEDYAARRGVSLEQAEKWLRPNLD